jgi:hypothetical protein
MRWDAEKKNFYSLQINVIYHIECADYQKKCIFLRTVTARDSTRRIVILPGITSSMTRNPLEEWLIHWEITTPCWRIHRRNGILPRITGSWTRIPLEKWNSAGNYTNSLMRSPPEDWNFAGNYQLLDTDFGRQDQKSSEQ